MWQPIDSDVAAFADGGAGHVFEFGAAPNVGDIDILFVNSDTVVSTPSGFTCPSGASQVNNQGAYGYYRQAIGGESDDVTITTSGNHPAVVGWQRWRGGSGFDVAVGAQINSAIGGTTPTLDTGTLAGTGELVVVAALLHRLATPTPSAPVWSSGYTGLTEVTQGSGTTGVTQFTAYKTTAGTAAETPSCTWTDGAFDRYAIAMVFTPSAGTVVELARAQETDTGRALAVSKAAGLTRATSTETGQPLTLAKTVALGRATETDTGRPLALSKAIAINRAGSTETASPLVLARALALGRATESDTGRALAAVKTVALGRATETSTARSLAHSGTAGPTGPGTLTPSTTGSTLTASTQASSTLTITRTP